MSRGSTSLDSNEYDHYLAKKGKTKELNQRKSDRRNAHNANGEGWHFGLASEPVRIKNKVDFNTELDQRGLARRGEYKGGKKCPKMSELEAQWQKRNGR